MFTVEGTLNVSNDYFGQRATLECALGYFLVKYSHLQDIKTGKHRGIFNIQRIYQSVTEYKDIQQSFTQLVVEISGFSLFVTKDHCASKISFAESNSESATFGDYSDNSVFEIENDYSPFKNSIVTIKGKLIVKSDKRHGVTHKEALLVSKEVKLGLKYRFLSSFDDGEYEGYFNVINLYQDSYSYENEQRLKLMAEVKDVALFALGKSLVPLKLGTAQKFYARLKNIFSR